LLVALVAVADLDAQHLLDFLMALVVAEQAVMHMRLFL
jgi:hypothetical protein